MSLLSLPKNPKVDDLIPLLSELDKRIVSLEAYVVRNDQRITALEAKYDGVVLSRGTQIAELQQTVADHQAGAVKRQSEVDQLRAETGRMRWSLKTGRRL